MKIKVSEASGVVLDWLVARCEGAFDLRQLSERHSKPWQCSFRDDEDTDVVFYPYLNELEYSTDWALGGPIFEREKIQAAYTSSGEWRAQGYTYTCVSYGPTELTAKARCFVTSKLGDVVEVPDELSS